MEAVIKVEKPVAYLEHKATKTTLPVYTSIGWFRRLMLHFCFGLEYNKRIKL